MNIIINDKLIDQEIKKELLEYKAKYGCKRRCKIVKGGDDMIPNGGAIVAMIIKIKNSKSEEETDNAFAFGPYLAIGLAVATFFGTEQIGRAHV